MSLHYREYGQQGQPELLLLHGLFGSSSNWHSIARALQGRFHIRVPDLRNHGRSPHRQPMDYPSMGADILELMDAQDLPGAHMIGHSMGGKLAMWLALNHPQRVHKLCSVDMAPVGYTHSFADLLDALESVSLNALQSRRQADQLLQQRISRPALRGFLLQNLVLQEGQWHWRINLAALRSGMQDILGFPQVRPGNQFPGATLFIHGGLSDYIRPEYMDTTLSYFPHARMRVIPSAGHWVYAEAPKEFLGIVDGFL